MKHTLHLGLLLAAIASSPLASALEYHVSPLGNDTHNGKPATPLKTISAAATLAQPGDVVTVHEGIYRERIDPPRGGTSNENRVTYQAAKGEKVIIKGSEVIKGWKRVEGDVWEVNIPNDNFADFNPFKDLINGDWFTRKGRNHHTGAVYLNGHWLIEAAQKEQLFKPTGKTGLWFTDDTKSSSESLLNVAWFQIGTQKTQATSYDRQQTVKPAPCSEGGKCIGWIEDGDWARYSNVDFGNGAKSISLRVASDSVGGKIEIRKDNSNGELLGTCEVAKTGGWQKWISVNATIKPTSGKNTICLNFKAPGADSNETDTTTIWAQFKGLDPNKETVEVNTRQSVFYPSKTGVNYITVRGFTLEQAATPWAPPTAEQIGIIGTNWSKGWIIENNTIQYSTCTGVTLGKHGDEFDNTSANSATGYVKTIERATARGWNKKNIGHHIVRDNLIAHCEQAGIVGSLGAIFSTVTGNHIHHINFRQLFSGAEMSGIKFHAAMDSTIANNHIHHCIRGIWLDWMTEGTRVTRNLLHHNGGGADLFLEVNHGPVVVDNNIMLSAVAMRINSQGDAYAHNLMLGKINILLGERRMTPWLLPHSTKVGGLAPNKSGDERHYNNLYANGPNFSRYNSAKLPVWMQGNVFFLGAKPSKHAKAPMLLPKVNPDVKLVQKDDSYYLEMNVDNQWKNNIKSTWVTTSLMGKTKVGDKAFLQPDGSPYQRIDTDYFGKKRTGKLPAPGPFAAPKPGKLSIKVWPRS